MEVEKMKQDRLSQVRDYQNFVTKFRKSIPDHYNQIELVDKLMNQDLDFYISISNRSDGKTFNYVSFFLKLAIEFDIKFVLISRHFTLRNAYVELLERIAIELKHFDSNKLSTQNTQDYVAVYYGDKEVAIITDLNNATDLKYHSNYMKHFPIIIYDEFLALESDYLIDEWEKLKTIYESIDRNHGNIPYLKIPKIVLLGNAVNFSSPLLANLNIYEDLQHHGTYAMNSMRQYDNILLEMRRNEFSNEERNTRAFKSDQDAMTTGEFDFNTFNLADEPLRNHISKNGDFFHIKTPINYIKVMYNVSDYQANLKVVPYAESYQFCTDVHDVEKNAIFLKETFYKENHSKRYYNPSNLHFENAYSKTFILNEERHIDININKLIKQHKKEQMKKRGFNDFARHEKIHQDNYLERSKEYLVKRFG